MTIPDVQGFTAKQKAYIDDFLQNRRCPCCGDFSELSPLGFIGHELNLNPETAIKTLAVVCLTCNYLIQFLDMRERPIHGEGWTG